jgi:hypothetical protein
MSDNDHHDEVPRRKRPGRPRSASPRDTIFVIRASDAEAAAIRGAATAARLPIAIYLRRRGLNQIIATPLPISDVQTVSSLSSIGHNLNQAIRLAHDGRAPAWPAASVDELRNLCAVLANKIIASAR